MKKKTGFTLIELLAVLVIFGVLCALAIPTILNQVHKQKSTMEQKNILLIGKAASLYYDNNLKPSSTYCVTLQQLVDQELLATPITNYETGTDYALTQYVEIKTDMNRIETYRVLAKGSVCTPTETTAVTTIAGKNKSGNTEGLITDDTANKNIRYAGSPSSVKNYVMFNNEMWRIIGIFDGKLKIVRNEAIGSQVWDSKGTYGVSNWPTSDLNTYLNNVYLNSMNDTSRNMIADTVYPLGNVNSSAAFLPKASYVAERGTTVYTGCSVGTYGETSSTCPRAKTWTGVVGLLYASDYGYAAGTDCKLSMDEYDETNCKTNNWLYSGNSEWTITLFNRYVLYIDKTGFVDSGMGKDNNLIRPVVYLRSHVKIISGNGTQTSPYRLSL